MADTRNRILDLGEHLIRSKGYNAFSYKDVSQVLNIRNAAVHYHFPAKVDLGLAVIQRNMDQLDQLKVASSQLAPPEQLDRFIRLYQKSGERNLVCFMGALGPSYESLPAPMQAKLRVASHQILDWINTILASGKANGQFQFTETAEQKAHSITTSLLSSLILNKVTGEDILASVVQGIQQTV